MSAALRLDHVSAFYGAAKVLDDLSLAVGAGEMVSLLGASGCGKTTTLRLVAGFLTPSAGTIRLADTDLTRLPAHRRQIGLVFQSYALFPHLTVRDNVAFGLKQRGVGVARRRAAAMAMLERVGLAPLADRLPAALSGGQKQRVALARALVIEPPLLMLDEPLSNLDARLRIEMRVEIRQLQQARNITALYVTHDQEEAFAISDRVAIMQAGRVVQYDRPEVLYRRPVNDFVARFVGFDNLVPLQAVERDGALVTVMADGGDRFELSQEAFGPIPDRCVLAARADGFALAPAGAPGLRATVALRTYLGRAHQYRCQGPAGTLVANAPPDHPPLEPGAALVLRPLPAECALLPALGDRR